jgi:branched-chain amino acid transport system ATP-binding protein
VTALLSVSGLGKHYFGVAALGGVSFRLSPGAITGLIGPNGSGKSTLFDCVTGFTALDEGRVDLAGQDITGQTPDLIARRGLTRSFQNLKVFQGLGARDNLLTAAQAHQGFSMTRELLGGPLVRHAEAAARERAEVLLRQVGLTAKADTPAGQLSYGQQKLIAICMALMPEPRLVLLDEPVAGVNPTLIEHIKEHIRTWNAAGTAFLIIEHNLRLIMDLCDRVLVLDRGRLLVDGSPAEVAADGRVIEAYLGHRRTA